MDIVIYKKYKSTGGDEMSHYDASFAETPTLQEFVSWILTNRGNEWGRINGKDFWTTYVEYSHGKIVNLCNNYLSIKDKKIALYKMDGGRSSMDYTIEILE